MRIGFASALAVCGVIVGGGDVTAQQAPRDTIVFSWAPGVEVHHQAYREPSLNVSETGWFGGLTLDGRMTYNQWQLRGDTRLAYGSMDYSGSGTLSGIHDFVFEGRILGAYEVSLTPMGDAVTPYLGYGYRRLTDYLGGLTTSTGATGYDRVSQYHYLPVGVETSFRMSSGWRILPTIEYDYFLQGSQDSYLSQAVAGLSDMHNTQNSGYGLRGSLMMRTTVGQMPIEFGPFIRYWNIKQSDIQPVTFNGVTVGGGFEPANNTTEVGAGFKVWF